MIVSDKIAMFDTITLSTLPPDPQSLAGYVGGWWPTWSAECQKYTLLFKEHRILSIAVNAGEDAECLDIENGDATPEQAPDWVRRQKARGVILPCLYASISVMPTVLRVLESAGIHRNEVRLWTAHYTYRAHICSPICGFGFETTANATQWTDRAFNRNLDESLVYDTFFGTKVIRPVENLAHYERFDTRHRMIASGLSEAWVVKEYDKYRREQTFSKHPHRYELGLLRIYLRALARRVQHEAIIQPRPGTNRPSWNRYYRGWRYQNLIHRADGKRLAA